MKEIKLTRGLFALVDDSDYEWLNQCKWYANKIDQTFYACRGVNSSGNRSTILMHRLILGLKPGDKRQSDHINQNGLDNQRTNLRSASASQNQANRRFRKDNHSGYRGVRWDKQKQCWRADITFHSKSMCLGLFKNRQEAAMAYDLKAKEFFGEFANLNFPISNAKTALKD